MDEIEALHRARRAAAAHHAATAHVVEFAERLSTVYGPAEVAEFDALVAREAATLSDRVLAFQRLGLGLPSLEDGDSG